MIRRRTRILLRDAVVTALVVVVLAAAAIGAWRLSAHRHRPPAAPANATGPAIAARRPQVPAGSHPAARARPQHRSPAPALGVYVGPGAAAQAEAVDAETGGKVSYALEYLPADTWEQLSDPTWIEQQWGPSPFRLVLAVPMLPSSGGTLAEGATGAYDEPFALLAQRLVAGGLGGSVLMVGWQPGSPQHPWQVTTATQAAHYVTFWDRIHQVMSGTPGAHFQFEWDAGGPAYPIGPQQTYPGNAAVDIVATDAFDVDQGTAPADQQWSSLLDESTSPSWIASFAAAHGKRFALAMCGLASASSGGGGDNAAFLNQSLAWAEAVHASLYVLWDYGTGAVTGGGYPAAAGALVRAVDQGIVGSAGGQLH
ncbi:MAG: hypothetical protein ACRDY3_13250 [Acidimicrobiales bacterium]